jgi:hypothetical protein
MKEIGMDADERFLWCADPLAAPDWRWQRACAFHRRPRRRRRRPDDPDWLPTLLALAEKAYPSGRRRRGPRLVIPPALIEALDVYQGGGQLRWELEARLLAGQTDEDIAAATAVPAGVVAMYERPFFGVRKCLAARDYILSCVVGGAPLHGFDEGDLRSLWAYFGYAAGPKMLELVMSVSVGRPLPDWAVREAPNRAALDSLELAIKAMLMACFGAMTPSKLQKLRVIGAQMVDLRRMAPPKALQNSSTRPMPTNARSPETSQALSVRRTRVRTWQFATKTRPPARRFRRLRNLCWLQSTISIRVVHFRAESSKNCRSVWRGQSEESRPTITGRQGSGNESSASTSARDPKQRFPPDSTPVGANSVVRAENSGTGLLRGCRRLIGCSTK